MQLYKALLIIVLCANLSYSRAPKCSEDLKCGSRAVQWSPKREGRVIGGQIPPMGAIPWQIAILSREYEHLCGGALISSRLVLSAAHCKGEGLRAVAGGHGPLG